MFSARLRPLLLAVVWISLGFQAKILQTWLIRPVLAVGYLVAAPAPPRRRVVHVLTAGAVTLAVSLSWVAVVTFVPASERPYVDGTTDNRAVSMVFGYNGLNRFSRDLISGSVSQMNDTVGAPQGKRAGPGGRTGPGGRAEPGRRARLIAGHLPLRRRVDPRQAPRQSLRPAGGLGEAGRPSAPWC
ncbi:hypothetical protein [Streptomyces sp. NPDC056405]|uniref:hypothetical protein n=1 Tax=Streptomyces sp. NPDC056405 TaxID=3345811 RepID=UPI0035E05F0A